MTTDYNPFAHHLQEIEEQKKMASLQTREDRIAYCTKYLQDQGFNISANMNVNAGEDWEARYNILKRQQMYMLPNFRQATKKLSFNISVPEWQYNNHDYQSYLEEKIAMALAREVIKTDLIDLRVEKNYDLGTKIFNAELEVVTPIKRSAYMSAYMPN